MSASRQALGTVPAAAANAASPPPGLEELEDQCKYWIVPGNVWLRIELTDPLASATEYCVTEPSSGRSATRATRACRAGSSPIPLGQTRVIGLEALVRSILFHSQGDGPL